MHPIETVQHLLTALGVRLDLTTELVVFLLTFTRLLAAILQAPFLGGPSVPGQVKIGLTAVVALLIVPHATAGATTSINSLVFVGLIVKEAVIGSVIGLMCQVVFYGVQAAGTIVDTQRGVNQVSYIAPQLPGHTSALGNLQFQAALVLFLTANGHHMFLRALTRSFEILPADTFPSLGGGPLSVMEHAMRVTAAVLVIACQLSAPAVLALFLVDVAFGCIGKIAGQIRISNDSHTVKGLVGLSIVFLVMATLMAQVQPYFEHMMSDIGEFLRRIS